MGKFRRNWYSLYSTSLVALPLLAVIIGCPGARQSAQNSGGVVHVSTTGGAAPVASAASSPAVIVVPGAPGAAGAAGAAGSTGAMGPRGLQGRRDSPERQHHLQSSSDALVVGPRPRDHPSQG